MSTIACPGCGMPRAAELADTTPCPICDAVLPMAGDLEPEPITRPSKAQAALPADASELDRHRAAGFPIGWVAFGLFIGFAIGALAGVGGFYAWQKSNSTSNDTVAVDPPVKTEPAAPVVPNSPATDSAKVPPATTSNYTPPVPDPKIIPEPVVQQPLGMPPPAGAPVVIDIDDQGTYSLPFPTRKGEHVILRGKAKVLKLAAIENGAIIDATGLTASEIHVEKVDGASTVKLNAPEGAVTFAGKVDGKSVVIVNAPGGIVRFPTATIPGQDGAKIDGGSKLTITAKRVELRGDLSGTATHVSVILTRAGALRVATVQGTAVLEYRMENSGWSISDVTVGPVAPTATVRDLSASNASNE